MKRNRVIVFTCGVLFFLVITQSNAYLITQIRHFLSDQFHAKKINTLLQDSTLPHDERIFFLQVQSIKRFAVDSLGLSMNNNYTTYINTDKKYLITVLFGCKTDTFAAYQWRFPFVGRFPYIGYYEDADAKKARSSLEKKGYEVFSGRVDAFSSLGYFKDPLYTFMKEYTTFELANVLVHELTHATIFIKDNVDFNEELATFIGREGALFYLRQTQGDSARTYTEALSRIKANKQFYLFLKSLHDTLETVYGKKISSQEKLSKKTALIDCFRNTFTNDYDSLFTTDMYKGYCKRPWNNAMILYYMTYSEDLSPFYALYEKCGNNLRKTITALKILKTVKTKPREYLEKQLIIMN